MPLALCTRCLWDQASRRTASSTPRTRVWAIRSCRTCVRSSLMVEAPASEAGEGAPVERRTSRVSDNGARSGCRCAFVARQRCVPDAIQGAAATSPKVEDDLAVERGRGERRGRTAASIAKTRCSAEKPFLITRLASEWRISSTSRASEPVHESLF